MAKLLAPRSLPAAQAARHPAYTTVMGYYASTGKSVTRALREAAEVWDVETLGELPSRQSVHRWVVEDDWDEYIEAETGVVRRGLREKVNNTFFAAAPELARQLINIAHGDFSDPKAATVQVGAIWKVMQALGVGVLENKTGDVPEGDETEGKKLRSRLATLPITEIQDLQRQRIRLLDEPDA